MGGGGWSVGRTAFPVFPTKAGGGQPFSPPKAEPVNGGSRSSSDVFPPLVHFSHVSGLSVSVETASRRFGGISSGLFDTHLIPRHLGTE